MQGRKDGIKKLKEANMQECIWFHCSSLGEFEQGRPLMAHIRTLHPEYKILLTFFSPSGYEQKKHEPLADYVMYLPSDTAQHAKVFLEAAKPRIAVFVKYDLWLHVLFACYKREVPFFLISAEFRASHWLFHPLAKPYRAVLTCFTHIFVQSRSSYDLLLEQGCSRVTLAGDTRIDRVLEIREQPFSDDIISRFKADRPLLIAGSVWPDDMQILFEKYIELPFNAALVIVPHEIEPTALNSLTKRIKQPFWVYSRPDTHVNEASMLVIDTMGMLSRLYRYANWAYIGGGFGKNVHNILEPAVYGIPVCFGPNHKKFPEASWLIAEGQAQMLNSADDLSQFIQNNPPVSLPRPVSPSVFSRRGAVQKIYSSLSAYL